MPECTRCNADVLAATLKKNRGWCAKCRRLADEVEQFPQQALAVLKAAAVEPPGDWATLFAPHEHPDGKWLVDAVIDAVSAWRQPTQTSYERVVFDDGEYEFAPVVIFEDRLDYLYISEGLDGALHIGKAAGDPPADLVTPDVE